MLLRVLPMFALGIPVLLLIVRQQPKASPDTPAIPKCSLAHQRLAWFESCMSCTNTTPCSHVRKLPSVATHERHFQHIWNVTQTYQNPSTWSWTDFNQNQPHEIYRMEALWRSEFSRRPASYWYPLVPLFVPWLQLDSNYLQPVGIHPRGRLKPAYEKDFRKWLRADFLYITVVAQACGLYLPGRSNIVVLSQGGKGNVVLPLLRKEQAQLHSVSKKSWFIYDYSRSLTAVTRATLQRIVNTTANVRQVFTTDWQPLSRKSWFTLAPRGFGRTSFRLYEILQLGDSVPVYVFDDMPFLPYTKHINWTELIVLLNPLRLFAQGFNLTTYLEEYYPISRRMSMIQNIRSYRQLFTYAGVINQLENLLSDPTGNSHQLSCVRSCVHQTQLGYCSVMACSRYGTINPVLCNDWDHWSPAKHSEPCYCTTPWRGRFSVMYGLDG